MIFGCSLFGFAFWFLGMWQWWAFYCWMALIVGISISEPWLLCRLLFLLKVLALIKQWVYAVWCSEYCGVPVCILWWCSRVLRISLLVVENLTKNKPNWWTVFCKFMASNDVWIWKGKLMIWKHFVKGFEDCVGRMDPTDWSLCFIY